MPEAISNTSPLLYLYRAGVLGWVCEVFSGVWIPRAVVAELQEWISDSVRQRVLALAGEGDG